MNMQDTYTHLAYTEYIQFIAIKRHTYCYIYISLHTVVEQDRAHRETLLYINVFD